MHIFNDIHPVITYTFAGLLGACLGSYAALIIERLPAGISTVTPRSRCDSCKAPLRFWQNIPLISWLLLRGRCFFCRSPIGARALFIEAIFALSLIAIFAKFGAGVLALEKCFFVFLLICASYIDLDTFYLPNILIFFLVVLGLVSSVYFYINPSDYIAPFHTEFWLRHMVFLRSPGFSWFDRLLGAVVGFSSLWGINIVATAMLRKSGRLHKGQWAMGFGDPLLMMAIGIFVGLSHLVLTIFLASSLGSIFGILQRLLKPKAAPAKDVADGAVPFGPFLSLSAIYVYLF